MRIDRHEAIGLIVFAALLFATLAPIAERARAGFVFFEIMERVYR
ncbi:hypothetical protein ONR75_11085 [Rhodopseudomonas sp. P2A-2r]|nr:hypothetical protein [Rhodopseudomonas sp. P2A-2r]UZE51103.1 hypothetical protein ONR75_11085 [Rhodopseudomonas sp. P2A-2r]